MIAKRRDLTRGSLTTTYQVDQLGQVTAQTSPDGITASYSYDEAGQRAVVTGPSAAARRGEAPRWPRGRPPQPF
jgi:YD repeat-containing protein